MIEFNHKLPAMNIDGKHCRSQWGRFLKKMTEFAVFKFYKYGFVSYTRSE